MKIVAILVLPLLLTSVFAAQELNVALFPIVQNGKWGYINQTGKVVITPKFEQANSFVEGLARVKVAKLYGFIDQTGKLIVPARYQAAGNYSEGLARVMVASKWGFINKSGQMVIPAIFGDATNFSNGAFSATLQPLTQGNRQNRLADRTGKFVSPPNLNVVSTFSEGLALVATGDGKDFALGYINKQWEVVINPQYLNAMPFRDGLAVVQIRSGKSFVIDKMGKTVINNDSVSLDGFSEGLISFYQFNDKTSQGLYGFLDKNGVVAIKPRFQDVENFSEGLALVKFREKLGFIDSSGTFLIKPQFDNAESFSNGLAMVWVDGKLGYIGKTGKYVWEPTE